MRLDPVVAALDAKRHDDVQCPSLAEERYPLRLLRVR